MIHHVTIPRIGTAAVWRDIARGFLADGVAPEHITWGDATHARGLFETPYVAAKTGEITVPRTFVSLANSVVWHSDPERFTRLYALLWRLQDTPHLMADRADPQVGKLRQLEKAVHRCQHKMKAFVRFRDIGAAGDNRRTFAAWFEPTHYTVEPTATFFRNRFADMNWSIFTPDVSAIFKDGTLTFRSGLSRPELPPDASEALWITYFQNIFNPGRLKTSAMQSEMPKKYWKNLPEAPSIAKMITDAPARAREMVAATATLPPLRTERVLAQQARLTSQWDGPKDALPAAISACTRCPLHCDATQAVLGEGPADADLMVVGEQPGDHEDITGRPFVGPAGQMFDTIARSAGLDRRQTFLTNAVKHFKFKIRGKKRLHQSPIRSEIEACRVWLDAERQVVKPKLIIAMGATAAQALTGDRTNIQRRRGRVEQTADGTRVLITFHPAYLLRLPPGPERDDHTNAFRSDLAMAARIAQHAERVGEPQPPNAR